MGNLISIHLLADFGMLKKPDTNEPVYLTFNMLHKPALLGVLGAIAGFQGFQKHGSVPEYLEKLKNVRVGISPLETGNQKFHDNGNFAKTIIKYNNSTGLASDEAGGNWMVTEQTLVKPAYRCYILLDETNLDHTKLKHNLLGYHAEYLPYMGKNECSLWWNNAEVLNYSEFKPSGSFKINSLFIKEESLKDGVQKTWFTPGMEKMDGSSFMYFENLPVGYLGAPLYQYDYKGFAFTDFELKAEIGLPEEYPLLILEDNELFRSSEQIIKENELLFNNLKKIYWAHIDGVEKKTESLFQHSRLVADYALKLIHTNGLEPVIDNTIDFLVDSISLESPESAKAYIKEIFINSIFFHDLGKVNPNFQALRMKNPDFRFQKRKIEHYHSFPGAYIFCTYYFDKIDRDDQVPSSDKNFLFFLTFCLVNSVIRHHSSYIDFSKSFEGKERELAECHELLKSYELEIESSFCTSFFSNYELIVEGFMKKCDCDDTFICIYILVKLSYSLLTASDFYATNEFMAGLRVSEFGLIDSSLKLQVKSKFWSVKSYNADLQDNFDYFLNEPFEKLQLRNSENLNLLRQKLTAEAVSTIQKYPQNHWYFIEAPTGAGKTNISLACITELLEKDNTLNKVFYVFPFTTLITQTFKAIEETIGLTNNELIQLHSKTGLHYKSNITSKNEVDANYGNERLLYLDHLFVNYPFVVTSHVKFFEIIKSNEKETNYLFHRLCNSIVVIDELQSYNPKHWDKMVYFMEHYARLLNMRFIIMSATLPKIDDLHESTRGKFISLTPNRDQYFSNPNFMNRVDFDFSLIDELKPFKSDKNQYLKKLAALIHMFSEEHARSNQSKVRTLIEFITKNTASTFYDQVRRDLQFKDYQTYLLSGDILEPRRQEVIRKIKNYQDDKVILISTQVVEAGVDIDMDLGFKNRAILDSDEQLAGRVNRNASKNGCKVYLFELDSIKTIYGKDERFKQQFTDEVLSETWQEILVQKKFHELYTKVFAERLRNDWTDSDRFSAYQNHFKTFDFNGLQRDFQLIEDNQSETVFIPINIEIPKNLKDVDMLQKLKVLNKQGFISGEKVFDRLIEIITRERIDFLSDKVDMKKIAGIVSLFTINVYPGVLKTIGDCFDLEKGKYGFKYLLDTKVYTYENGFDMSKAKEDVFL